MSSLFSPVVVKFNTTGSTQPMSHANKFVKELSDLDLKPNGADIDIQDFIAQHMLHLGAEVGYHEVHHQLNTFHPLHFFFGPDSGIIRENYSCSTHGTSLVGIVRAPQGDGKEAIVLVTPFNSQNIGSNALRRVLDLCSSTGSCM